MATCPGFAKFLNSFLICSELKMSVYPQHSLLRENSIIPFLPNNVLSLRQAM
jgi:hypothetical protein